MKRSVVENRTRWTGFGLLLLFVLNSTAVLGQVVENDEHILTKIAEGVYAIRHRRASRIGALSGNTTVIIGDQDVLVVDSGSLPSVAQADIAQIKKWTNKPVRYLVNTHWHGDHTWGNGIYLDTFPGLTIIAHTETSRQMQGYLPFMISNNMNGREVIKRVLETGKDTDGSTLSEAAKTRLKEDLPNVELRSAEYKTLVTRLPNLTFEGELNLNLGNREVQIKHLGRGNTAGDIIVYFPHEKIVVAGDLLVYPFPFLIGGFPSEWSKTLRLMSQLEPRTIVPGHGAVLVGNDGKAYLNLVTHLLEVVTAAVRQETFKVGNFSNNLDAVIEAVKKNPEVGAVRQRFAGDDPDQRANFDRSLPRLITAAYREAWGN